MDEQELDKLYYDLEEIEAILGIFASLEHNLSSEYISIVSNKYLDKIINIRKRIQKKLDKSNPLAK